MPDPDPSSIAFDALVLQQLALARQDGIPRPPVLLFPSTTGNVGRAVLRELHGSVPDPPSGLGPADWTLCERLSIPDAIPMLKAHAGHAEGLVAGHLADQTLGNVASYWVVVLLVDGIGYGAFCDDGTRLLGGGYGYETPPRRDPSPEEIANDPGPSSFPIELASGERVRVYGPTGLDAVMAANLLSFAISPTVLVTHPTTGKAVRLPVTDNMVVDLLLKCYSKGAGPRQVAEVVAALKKAAGNPGKKFLAMLRNRPGLAELRRRVDRELTGVDG